MSTPTHFCPDCMTHYFEALECDWCPGVQVEEIRRSVPAEEPPPMTVAKQGEAK